MGRLVMTGGLWPVPRFGDDELSQAVIAAVAAAENVEPAALDQPLGETIDPDALNALFPRPDETDWLLRFEYHGYVVSITSDGSVTAEPPP